MTKPTKAQGTVLITGANGGLGCGIVSKILSTMSPGLSASSSIHGIYTVRDASSCPALRSVLSSSSSSSPSAEEHPHEIISLDLSRLSSVRDVARGINARVAAGEIPPIRALILNAGLSDLGEERLTEEDGFDNGFASTYLGHWLLTLLLLESVDRERGRVVVLGSAAYDTNNALHRVPGYYADPRWKLFVTGDTIDAIARGTWSTNAEAAKSQDAGVRRYGAAKMCCVMMALELQRRLDADPLLSKIGVVTVDPGAMDTGIMRRADWFTRLVLFGAILRLLALLGSWMGQEAPTFRTVERSAGDLVAAAFDEDDSGLRGKVLDGHVVQEVVPEAADEKKRAIVWRDSVKYTKLRAHDTILADWK